MHKDLSIIIQYDGEKMIITSSLETKNFFASNADS